MSSGSSSNSRANLTRAGGDRHKDKKALIAVIEAVLVDSFSDAEIRRHFGLEVLDEISAEHREKLARSKAAGVYAAILDGWRAGMMGDLRLTGGVNIGGILRIGKIKAAGLVLVAEDIFGGDLKELGVPIYRRATLDNGYYAERVGIVSGSAVEAQLLALGWVLHWAGSGTLFYGPVVASVWGQVVQVPAIGGGMVAWPAYYRRWGTKNKTGPGFYVWAYRDAGGVEHPVHWRKIKINKVGNRLKSKIPNRFWADLNNVIY